MSSQGLAAHKSAFSYCDWHGGKYLTERLCSGKDLGITVQGMQRNMVDYFTNLFQTVYVQEYSKDDLLTDSFVTSNALPA